LLSAASAAPVDSDILNAFSTFTTKYGKQYDEVEYARRVNIFADNLERINKQNAQQILAGGDPVFGITQFADLSQEEFKSMYLNARIPLNDTAPRTVPVLNGPPANDIDWRGRGVLTPVKDQGQCGSCWAFSATAAIESFAALAGKPLSVLAPQQIVSCDTVDFGCSGGWPYNAYKYVMGAGGIEPEAAYPYTSGKSGQTGACHFDKSKVTLAVVNYKSVAQGESNLQTALNVGPVSVCVDANSWSAYTGGILKSCGRSVDHCVQAVGYTADYWIIRNSWGGAWGESGFMRIARGSDLCLISDYVTYPTY